MTTSAAQGLRALGSAAAGYVEADMKVGLGTGRAAAAFVRALGARVRDERLEVVGVATSEATRALAESIGIPLVALSEAGTLDLAVDGADEVDPRLDLIKGRGGALVREKIVAASSRRFVIVVGREKLVDRLGLSAPLPVEIVPFGLALCQRRLREIGARPEVRLRSGAEAFVSDNGNYILDCRFDGIEDPASLDRTIREIPGVVGTGLFVRMAERVLVQDGGEVRTMERPRGEGIYEVNP
jgi:ribose 5-phosphate isomerase A